jgi:hypothetical protein
MPISADLVLAGMLPGGVVGAMLLPAKLRFRYAALVAVFRGGVALDRAGPAP